MRVYETISTKLGKHTIYNLEKATVGLSPLRVEGGGHVKIIRKLPILESNK